MNTDQQTVRTRPRVSRACERCRVKKAKCDGEKPCRRCNLDQAPCSYKLRRKTDSASTNQRYTNLLIQHQEALTAGVVELYGRLVRGQRWDGAPVEEVNGSPSVHEILERLGVLDRDDDADYRNIDSYSTKNNNNNKSEPVSPVSLGRSIPPIIAPKTKRQVRTAVRREPVCHVPGTAPPEQRSAVAESPIPAMATIMSRTSTTCGPPPSALDADEVPPHSTYFGQYPSPLTPISDARSTSLSHCSGGRLNSTSTSTTSWVDSPVDDFCDELFGTPIPTPRTEVQTGYQPSDRRRIEPPPQPHLHALTPPVHQRPSAVAPPFASPYLSVTEAYHAEYFFDATVSGGGVSMYGWDGGPGGPGGNEYAAWETTGVYV
ncbi:hypothetical protein AYL99_02860 [Fonsecaea erecta]|uniref:Zn(2)-C6 fungal-type domain-containing protein n=1 Tax=Fonsecaea erecta TaxID=1367422 RepID=A0A178ZWI1_9EURO|nr:hypothetical protein AYL99_02860 [Fonsecaea erecta]OAP63633.1 hypothetical protein AYL99_02860 [Fonsecaea erecta]